MEHFLHQYRMSTAEQEAIVRVHLGRVLKEEKGGFALPASSIRVKIWWEKGVAGGWFGRWLTEWRLDGEWGRGLSLPETALSRSI